MTTPDFYTIGYSGRSIEQFIATLQEAGVKTLVDVRHLPLSRHKPDFGKARLRGHLHDADMNYLHLPRLGVPSYERKAAQASGTMEALWAWYDQHVLSGYSDERFTYVVLDARWPFALMCMESDPLTCHRHRLALALERLGLKGVDL